MSDTAMRKAAAGKPAAFNLMRWIDENADKLKPPTGGHTIFKLDDFMITVVGGPNRRTDFHVNPTEEFYFQIKGEMTLRIQHEGAPHDIAIAAGSIYALPANVPHAPMRPANTVGLIVERSRKDDQRDTHRWYCENCNAVLFEKTARIAVLERDMPPVFEAYYSDPANQLCKACGHVNAGRPGGP